MSKSFEGFQPFESKPIVRMARQIKSEPIRVNPVKSPNLWTCEGVDFVAYEPPNVGDWICRINEEDTYHVSDRVFRERNIVHD